MPSMPQSLSYSLVAGAALAVLAVLVLAARGDLVAAVPVLAVAAAAWWTTGRNRTTLVGAKDAAAATALVFALCALAGLLTGRPYEAIVFLLAAAALGFAFLALHQGTAPVELRLGGFLAVAAPADGGGLVHLRMLEALRDAGILSEEEFAAKRLHIAP